MNRSHTFAFLSRAAGHGVTALPPGQAVSLTPRTPMALRVAEGCAWVTLDGGPFGTGAASGDVFLHPGQTLWVEAGRHAVVEPVGTERLKYRWASRPVEAAASVAPWWRRAAFGNAAAVDQRVAGGTCCA